MTAQPSTLHGHLKSWVETDPQRLALIDPVPADAQTGDLDHGHIRVTVADLLNRANQLAALLAEQEIGEGDCVAVWLPSWADT
ncbi:MAG: hypothetical protein L0H43_15905, partial [Brevibacterium aurantiacum]|nr:hypothetical protein [Brevibacterium aurantiacum]